MDRRVPVIIVNVTQEHIEAGSYSVASTGSTHNPVAIAVCEALDEVVGSVHTWPRLGKVEHIGVKDAPLSDDVSEKLKRWELEGKIEPFSFSVDL